MESQKKPMQAEAPLTKKFKERKEQFAEKLANLLEPMERKEKLDFLKKKKSERSYILKNSEFVDLTETEKTFLEDEIEIIALEQIKITNAGDKKMRTADRLTKFRNGEL